MKKNRLISLTILAGVFALLTISCEKSEKVSTISDESFYKELGVTLIHCYTDIYNQNLAGQPTGVQNITTNGPMGGIVIITGSDSYESVHGITTVDLVFSMNAVQYVFTYSGSSSTWVTEVTLSGSTTYTGSFSDDYTSVNHHSDNLHIIGTVTNGSTSRSIDMSGAVSINRSTTTSVNIFGNTVSW